MSTIVAVMDRAGFAANTDNLVFVDPVLTRLLWVPRDLWCPVAGDRINAAYRTSGADGLRAALSEHGLDAAHSLVLSRTATEAALSNVSVLVPVPVPMAFGYPLTPTSRIEDGRKQIAFEPPAAVLRGERVHQWVGARGGSDLHRIERQKIFVRRLLEQAFAFQEVLADADAYRCSGAPALEELSRVRSSWKFETLGPLEPVTIDGKQVLVRREPGGASH